jgi:hypothetical protein
VTDSFAQPPPLSVLLVIPRKVVRVHSPYLDRGQDHSKGSVPGVLFLNSDPWGEDGKPLPSVILTWEPFAKVFWASWHWLHKWLDGWTRQTPRRNVVLWPWCLTWGWGRVALHRGHAGVCRCLCGDSRTPPLLLPGGTCPSVP